jgi:trehalose/maltose hydrolase-like predicted phosphorylase
VLPYRIELHLRPALLCREVVFRDRHGRVTRVESRRLVSMADPHTAALQSVITPENWSGDLEIESGIRHGVVNAGVARYRELNSSHLQVLEAGTLNGGVFAHVRTSQSCLEVAQATWLRAFAGGEELTLARETEERSGFIGQRLRVHVHEGESLTVEKMVALHSSRDRASAGCREQARASAVHRQRFAEAALAHERAWARLWRHADIQVSNQTLEHQRALRLHLFHLMQAVSPHSVELDCGVPARGWHGEAYRGHVFWDELFILPFFTMRFPDMARALLRYRHRRLDAARQAAREHGLNGALFPWQSASSGREETQRLHLNPRSGRWLPDNSSLQRHVNLAIAYNVWQYYQVTADVQFLRYEGGELIIEIARMMASLADHDPELDRYVIRGVVGPDEYHEAYPHGERPGIDNNAYTNVMTAWTMRCALDVLEVLPPEARDSLRERLDITEEELDLWDGMSRRIHVPFLVNGLIAQFDGYDDLREFDWEGYREKYGNIQRLDRILEAEGDSPNNYKLSKQADVLMLFYLLTAEEIGAVMTRLGYGFEPRLDAVRDGPSQRPRGRPGRYDARRDPPRRDGRHGRHRAARLHRLRLPRRRTAAESLPARRAGFAVAADPLPLQPPRPGAHARAARRALRELVARGAALLRSRRGLPHRSRRAAHAPAARSRRRLIRGLAAQVVAEAGGGGVVRRGGFECHRTLRTLSCARRAGAGCGPNDTAHGQGAEHGGE